MNFAYADSRKVRVEVKREKSVLTLVAIAVLIVLAFILLSFENVDEPAPFTNLTFEAAESSPGLGPGCDLNMDSRIEIKQQLRTSDLHN